VGGSTTASLGPAPAHYSETGREHTHGKTATTQWKAKSEVKTQNHKEGIAKAVGGKKKKKDKGVSH